jgi:hypothetical protein
LRLQNRPPARHCSCQEPFIRVGNAVLDAAPLLKALPPGATQDNDEVERQGGRVYLHLGARRDDPPRGLGGGAAALIRERPVAFAGLDPVTAAVGRPPRPAPGDWLRAVGRPSSSALSSDHAEAAAGQRGEGLSVVRRSWHGSRLQDNRGPSTACCRVLSLQLRLGGSSSQVFRVKSGVPDLVSETAVTNPPSRIEGSAGTLTIPVRLHPAPFQR